MSDYGVIVKLIICPDCQDVVKLISKLRKCQCERSWGFYEMDGLNSIIGGKAIPLGMDNFSLAVALRHRPESGEGKRFDAFVIPKECPTVKVEKKGDHYF